MRSLLEAWLRPLLHPFHAAFTPFPFAVAYVVCLKLEKRASNKTLKHALNSHASKPLQPRVACRYTNGTLHAKLWSAIHKRARHVGAQPAAPRGQSITHLNTNCTIWLFVTNSLTALGGRRPTEHRK